MFLNRKPWELRQFAEGDCGKPNSGRPERNGVRWNDNTADAQPMVCHENLIDSKKVQIYIDIVRWAASKVTPSWTRYGPCYGQHFILKMCLTAITVHDAVISKGWTWKPLQNMYPHIRYINKPYIYPICTGPIQFSHKFCKNNNNKTWI